MGPTRNVSHVADIIDGIGVGFFLTDTSEPRPDPCGDSQANSPR